MSTKPLRGICVVEIGHSVAAPFAGFILAELGADVIKVESPDGGDAARRWGPPFFDEAAPHFVALNRGKRSVTVKLGDGDERGRLRALILERADVVICNLRPGSADEMGLGAAALRAEKPGLIYAEIGAFGAVGPLAGAPGYDPLMQAYGGLMSITAEDSTRPPIRVAVSMIDMGAGFWAAISILAQLFERKSSAQGASVQTSLFETALSWVMIQLASVTIEPREMKPQGSGASGIVPYQAFRATDGWAVVAAGNDGLFRKLVIAMDLADLADDPRFRTNPDRVRNRDVLIPLLQDRFSSMTVAGVVELTGKAGVPAAPVQALHQVLEDPQMAALGIHQEAPDGGLRCIGLPLTIDGARPAYERRAPRLGEHNDEIFAPDATAAQARA